MINRGQHFQEKSLINLIAYCHFVYVHIDSYKSWTTHNTIPDRDFSSHLLRSLPEEPVQSEGTRINFTRGVCYREFSDKKLSTKTPASIHRHTYSGNRYWGLLTPCLSTHIKTSSPQRTETAGNDDWSIHPHFQHVKRQISLVYCTSFQINAISFSLGGHHWLVEQVVIPLQKTTVTLCTLKCIIHPC